MTDGLPATQALELLANRLRNARAVSATSRQPLSMVRAWPRSFSTTAVDARVDSLLVIYLRPLETSAVAVVDDRPGQEVLAEDTRHTQAMTVLYHRRATANGWGGSWRECCQPPCLLGVDSAAVLGASDGYGSGRSRWGQPAGVMRVQERRKRGMTWESLEQRSPERYGPGTDRRWKAQPEGTEGGDHQMSAEAASPISTYFRVCDGVRVRFADNKADSDVTVLMLAPWPETLWAFRRIWGCV